MRSKFAASGAITRAFWPKLQILQHSRSFWKSEPRLWFPEWRNAAAVREIGLDTIGNIASFTQGTELHQSEGIRQFCRFYLLCGSFGP